MDDPCGAVTSVWVATLVSVILVVVRPGFPLRAMEPSWPKRAMQFTDLGSGDLNMQRYAELLIHVGYPKRYMSVMGTKDAPLVVVGTPEEEALLNLHMNIIQENAELLTEEGRLLQEIQSDDHDIDGKREIGHISL